jgi:uncharacterized protein HemX
MAEPEHPSGDRPVYVRPAPARGGRPLAWLVALVLVAGAGYGAWRGAQWLRGTFDSVSGQQELLARLARDLSALRAQADELSTRQTELSQAVQRNGVDVATLGGRLEDSEQAVSRLSDTVEGGRARVQLAAVEQLLLLANDRLLLAHDAASALKALDLADQRLALINDPRLFRVREALAQERAALATLALPDYTGLALSVAELLQRAPQLPLRARPPERFEPPAAPAPPEARGLGRAWVAVKTALSSLFALRRASGPAPRLLPPEEEALVVQILQLKLEGARLALLATDLRTFHELIAGARRWLDDYYDETDPSVLAARAEMDRMQRLGPAPALPDISRSLALLRSQIGAAPR